MLDTMNPNEGDDMSRHNVVIDDELWAKALTHCLKLSVKEGRRVSVSEWIRGLIEAELK